MERITKQDVKRLAETNGIHFATWSPGDGTTRYRFMVHREDCPAKPQSEVVAERYCGCLDYFGASNVLGTCLGAKEAYTWLQGYRAAVLNRG